MTWRFSRQKPNYGSYALCISVLQALNGKSCYLKCLSVCFLQDREGGGEGVFSVILRHPCGGGERRFFSVCSPLPPAAQKEMGGLFGWVWVGRSLGRECPSDPLFRAKGKGGGRGRRAVPKINFDASGKRRRRRRRRRRLHAIPKWSWVTIPPPPPLLEREGEGNWLLHACA